MDLNKFKSGEDLSRISDEFRSSGRRLVFTNGCFDLLHVGHVRYLQQARELGDALVVAVNSDDSVRSLKGPNRPINPQEDRMEVLASLSCVDYVTPFAGQRVTELLRKVRPQVYAKGGDYTVESLDRGEVAALKDIAAEIIILPLVPGKSTTRVIQRMEAGRDEEFSP